MFAIKQYFVRIALFWNGLNHWIKIWMLVTAIIGSLVRFQNLFNLGFVYDTVTTQYDWAQHAINDGFVSFWKNYKENLDYVPGSLYLLMILDYIARLFGNTAHEFVIVLKSFLWIVEVIFAFILYKIARRYAGMSKSYAAFLGGLVYILPSLWFVSAVWGQMDSLTVVLSLFAVVALYKAEKRKSKKIAFTAGLLFGIALLTKMQAILLIPLFILFHLTTRKAYLWGYQLLGLLVSAAVILVVPLLANADRTGSVLAMPFLRYNSITNGGATFWSLMGMRGSGDTPLFLIGSTGISVSKMGFLIYAVLMFVMCKQYFGWKIIHIIKSRKFRLRELFWRKFSFLDFSLLMTVSSGMYFMFLTKMHSRYLHMSVLFSLITMAALGKRYGYKKWFGFVILMTLSYTLNQFDVFGTNNPEQRWVVQFLAHIRFDPFITASLFNLLSLVGMFSFAYHRFGATRNIIAGTQTKDDSR